MVFDDIKATSMVCYFTIICIVYPVSLESPLVLVHSTQVVPQVDA